VSSAESKEYIVERKRVRKWIPVCRYQSEDKERFVEIVNVEDYEYRIMHEGKDITKNYRRKKGVK